MKEASMDNGFEGTRYLSVNLATTCVIIISRHGNLQVGQNELCVHQHLDYIQEGSAYHPYYHT